MTERKRVSVGEAKAHFSAIVDDVLRCQGVPIGDAETRIAAIALVHSLSS